MNKFFKRLFDLIFSIAFLLVFSWLYLLTFVIIKIVSPGPAFYKAKRVGKNGRVFNCLKFRSMRVDSGAVPVITLRTDNRIFPFGKFIRRTKIDEFPQIFNILLNDMSVVGPRPEDPDVAKSIFIGEYAHILDVKPGLTSPASLYDYTHGELYEDEEEYEKNFLPDKLKLEMYYVKTNSFCYDLKIIIKTGWIIIGTIFGKSDWSKPEELTKI